MFAFIKKLCLKSEIRRHAMSIEGCELEKRKLDAEIAMHEEKRMIACAKLREIEMPVTVGSAFK